MRPEVKICGVTSEEDALMAAEAGARAIGLVFWEGSRRRVDRKAALRISRALPAAVWRVGVFVDASAEELESCAAEVGLDVLQLHGEAPLPPSGRRLWKAVGVGEAFVPEEALGFVSKVEGILLDAKTDRPGGSGTRFDWARARGVREGAPFLVVAGGLDPGNVSLAIRALRPDMVDVSTGVEASPGRKDRSKVAAFMEAVRKEEP